MGPGELHIFEQLKLAVAEAFRKRYPACSKPIQEWKGQEITDFQEDLAARVKGRISEKWFYTHMKTEVNEKLPRIDMLNLLSRYADYADWNDFVHRHGASQQVGQERSLNQTWRQNALSRRLAAAGGALAGIALLAWLAGASLQSQGRVTFCMVDAITRQPLNGKLEVEWLRNGESPQRLLVDAKGCVQIETRERSVRLAIRAPYYRPDTLIRRLDGGPHTETLSLQPDDYALMIHLFSTQNLEDWKKRREQLQDMIAEEARIFQVDPQGERGLELYNKEDFIDKLTLPIYSLKDIEVLEVLYDHSNRIRLLRFTQHPNDEQP